SFFASYDSLRHDDRWGSWGPGSRSCDPRMRHYPSPDDARGCGNTRTRETQIPRHGPRRGADSGGSRADAGYRPDQLPQEADQDHRPAILSVSLLGSFAIRNLMAKLPSRLTDRIDRKSTRLN